MIGPQVYSLRTVVLCSLHRSEILQFSKVFTMLTVIYLKLYLCT